MEINDTSVLVDSKKVQELVEKYGKDDLYKALYEPLGYSAPVPSIDEFIDNEYYLGKSLAGGIYPFWREQLRKIFPTPYTSRYNTIFLRGSIGIGKSSIAKVIFAYDLAKFLLMINPQQMFKLLPTKSITFFIISLKKSSAYNVLSAELYTWFEQSEFFIKNMDLSGKHEFKNRIDIMVGSRIQDNVGYDIPVCLHDEIQQEIVSNQVEDNYNSVSTRITSRFAGSNGKLPGHYILAGSAGGADDFAEKLTKRAKESEDSGILILEPRQWDVLACKGIYSGEVFSVYAGDDKRDPFIVSPTTDLSSLDKPERLITDVPIELKRRFEEDIYIALRDLAGISTVSEFKFFSSPSRLSEVFVLNNLFDSDKVTPSFFDHNDRIINYINLERFKYRKHPDRQRYIHIDLGISGDLTGISCVYISDISTVKRLDPISGKTVTYSEPVFSCDFCIGIGRLIGEETSIYKIKMFIFDLITAGVIIGGVSTDGYQSTQLRQELTLGGVKTSLISVDRTTEPYDVLKSAMYEKRFLSVRNTLLHTELKELVKVGGKIDHKPYYSKDLADSLAGATYNAYQNRSNFNVFQSVSDVSFDELTKTLDSLSHVDSSLSDFSLDLAKINHSLLNSIGS